MIMWVGSLLPLGLMQTWDSVEHGDWYARSGDSFNTGNAEISLAPRRGNTLIFLRAVVLVIFVAELGTGASFRVRDDSRDLCARRQCAL